ncbi:hypothetical protein FRC12_006885 [Ceratobasidium sp. 428]|nr:hypothetical protein FRC12_006885 [Ceratobasidium sp. 428]
MNPTSPPVVPALRELPHDPLDATPPVEEPILHIPVLAEHVDIVPQDPLPVAPLVEGFIPHIPILPDAVDMSKSLLLLSKQKRSDSDEQDLVEPVPPNGGFLFLPQAPAPLLGSLFGLQDPQNAQEN